MKIRFFLSRQFLKYLKWRRSPHNSRLIPLQNQIEYFFSHPQLLIQAITHKSVNPLPRENYERLEFLGDVILEQVISRKVFQKFPKGNEGLLTQRRSSLVQKSFLARISKDLNLLDYILISNSVDLSHKKVRENQLANVFEALIGAIYLDGGIKPCERIIESFVWKYRKEAWKNINYKGLLIEYCHSNNLSVPRFLVTSAEGPEHRKTFEVRVQINKTQYAPATAENKKAAEQKAAQFTMDSLQF